VKTFYKFYFNSSKCTVIYTIYDELWGVNFKCQKKYKNEIGISPKTETYIQPLALEKTLESISFNRKRCIKEDDDHNEVDTLVNKIIDAAIKVVPVVIQEW